MRYIFFWREKYILSIANVDVDVATSMLLFNRFCVRVFFYLFARLFFFVGIFVAGFFRHRRQTTNMITANTLHLFQILRKEVRGRKRIEVVDQLNFMRQLSEYKREREEREREFQPIRIMVKKRRKKQTTIKTKIQKHETQIILRFLPRKRNKALAVELFRIITATQCAHSGVNIEIQ